MIKKLISVLVCLLLAAGCTNKKTDEETEIKTATEATEEFELTYAEDKETEVFQEETEAASEEEPWEDVTEGIEDTVQAVITMESGDKITLELYPDVAPITVENFVKLCNEGFYDGLTFHRIIPGFMIQGGDPSGNGTGGPGYSIKGEFASNGVKNDLKHTRGVISMARSMMPDSAGSQFFIMHEDAPHLDGSYAAFGKVTDGLDAVDKIANVKTDYYDAPLEKVVIESIKITE